MTLVTMPSMANKIPLAAHLGSVFEAMSGLYPAFQKWPDRRIVGGPGIATLYNVHLQDADYCQTIPYGGVLQLSGVRLDMTRGLSGVRHAGDFWPIPIIGWLTFTKIETLDKLLYQSFDTVGVTDWGTLEREAIARFLQNPQGRLEYDLYQGYVELLPLMNRMPMTNGLYEYGIVNPSYIEGYQCEREWYPWH